MRGVSVPTSRARTPVTEGVREVSPGMHVFGIQHIGRMNRLGFSRYFGGWTKAASSNSTRSSGMVAVRAAATQAQEPPSAATGASASAASSPSRGPRVVVLGGGFGGLYAAVRLDQLMWPRGNKPQITLVDQSDRFVFKPLLYELLNGTATTEEVAPPLAQLLAPYPIRLVQAQALSVEPSAAEAAGGGPPESAGHVALSDGSSLPYDYLLVALGSQPDSRGVPGVREWAVPFNTYEDAVRVKGTLDLLVDSGAGGSVVVVGGGYAGVELAAVVGERLKGRGQGLTVRLMTPGSDILEGCPAGQRAAANQALAELGVRVMTGLRVQALGPPSSEPDSFTALPTACTVTYSPPGAADLASAAAAGEGADLAPPPPEQLAADLVIWTAGSSPATREVGAGAAARTGFPFPTNARGAILTEPSLRVKGSDVVFALGDVAAAVPEPLSAAFESASPAAAAPPPLPATAQVAFQEADYAAWNIWASINKRPLLPFRYQHLGSMMSLGQANAAVALPLDLPLPLADAVKASPLGPLLSAAGVKLGGGGGGGGGVTLEGPLAAVLRRGAYLYRQPTTEQRINVATSWVKMGLEAAAALAGGRAGR